MHLHSILCIICIVNWSLFRNWPSFCSSNCVWNSQKYLVCLWPSAAQEKTWPSGGARPAPQTTLSTLALAPRVTEPVLLCHSTVVKQGRVQRKGSVATETVWFRLAMRTPTYLLVNTSGVQAIPSQTLCLPLLRKYNQKMCLWEKWERSWWSIDSTWSTTA